VLLEPVLLLPVLLWFLSDSGVVFSFVGFLYSGSQQIGQQQ